MAKSGVRLINQSSASLEKCAFGLCQFLGCQFKGPIHNFREQISLARQFGATY